MAVFQFKCTERRKCMAMTLKAARVNKMLSQKDAAKLIGISEAALRHYEQGKTYPDVPVLKRIENRKVRSYPLFLARVVHFV